MAKNRTMAQKHLKAKKEGMKEVMTNQFAFMASTNNMCETAKWMLHHKPDYNTSSYKAKVRAVLSHA